MKLISSIKAKTYTNAISSLETIEYPVGDKDIDCALVKIKGLYPGENKFAVNTKSKELLFCIEGSGILEMKTGETRTFEKNDVLLIEVGEVYRFDANCLFVIVCSPPWTSEQQKKIDAENSIKTVRREAKS